MKINQYQIDVYRQTTSPISIKSEELVVGDIYDFNAGMMIPADSIIIHVDPLFNNRIECNESDVTGHKTMQIKGKLENQEEDLSNVLYAKTYIVKG